VTTDGEITEIKSQSKEVEVTANGTMDITPDAGFSYLNSVKVKTNVPTSGGGGGGGTELEGEYYLAKPNGRYWKSKLSYMMRNKYPVINSNSGSDFTYEEIEILYWYCVVFSYFGYTATYDYGGIPSSGSDVLLGTPTDVSKKAGEDEYEVYLYKQGIVNNISLMGAWQECNTHMSLSGTTFNGGLVDFMHLIMGSELDTMSDDEVLALVSEMFMLEQVTKEEYESYHNW
jgi:hypothetical protein